MGHSEIQRGLNHSAISIIEPLQADGGNQQLYRYLEVVAAEHDNLSPTSEKAQGRHSYTSSET